MLLSHICVGCVCVRRGCLRAGEAEVRDFEDGAETFSVREGYQAESVFLIFSSAMSIAGWHDEGMHVYEVK